MKLFKWDIVFATVTIFTVMIIFPIFFNSPSFDPIKRALQDFSITDVYFSQILEKDSVNKDNNIVLVNVSYQSQLGLRGFDAFKVSQVLNTINEQKPSVIGVDYLMKYDEKSSTEYNPVFTQFIKTMTEGIPNLVLASNFKKFKPDTKEYSSLQKPDTNIFSYKDIAYNNVISQDEQENNTIRKFTPYVDFDSKKISSFPIKLVEKYDKKLVEEFGKKNLEKATINFVGNDFKFKIVDAIEIMEGKINKDDFENKIVIVGVFDTTSAFDNLQDMYFTPLNQESAGKTFPDMYSTIINANIVSMLVSQSYSTVMPLWIEILISAFVCYSNMIIFFNIKEKNEKFYEVTAVLLFLFESIGFIYITVATYAAYKLEINLTLSVISAALSVLFYEIYFQTIKPLFVAIGDKFIKKKLAQ